jgi:hypothetical protein
MRQLITAIMMSAALAGCATKSTEKSVSLQELQQMRPDCSNADLQIRYFTQQLEINGYNQERSAYERQYVALAKEMIWILRSTCVKNLGSRS